MCARTKRPPLALKRLPRPPSGVHMLLHAVAHRVRTFISCHWRLSAELISLHQASHVPHLPTARHTREVAAQVLQARAERCRANSSLPHTRCVPKICPPRHGPGSPCEGETSRHVRSSPPLHTPTTVIINFTLHFLFGLRQFGSSQEDERRLEDVEVQDRSLRRLSENIHHGSSPFALAPISKQHATVTTKKLGVTYVISV